MSTSASADKDVVLVTGSGGRLGLSVLHGLGGVFRLVGFDRDGQPQPPKEVECVCVDLTRPESLALGVDRLRYAYGNRIASVIHLAAYHDFSGRSSPLYREVTVRGTARLLAALKDFEVEQIVFSSTVLVHRPTRPGVRIDEESPLEARWAYPESKIETEQVLREQRGDVPVVSLRIAGVYTDHCDSIPIASQIERILSHPVEGRVFPGNPEHGQPYVHMEDTVTAIRRCVDRRHDLPRDFLPILISEPTTLSYATLQRELGKLLRGDPDWPTHQIPAAVAKAVNALQQKLPFTEPLVQPRMIERADDHYEVDVSRAAELLGWRPRHDLMETIPRMVESLARDPEEFARRNGIELDASAASEAPKGRGPDPARGQRSR